MKRVRFWGTRGSLPVALTAAQLRRRLEDVLRSAPRDVLAGSAQAIDAYLDTLGFAATGTYGGHSACVELETGGPDAVICDLGSGARPLGQALVARQRPGFPQTCHVFMSHAHWDHIMGMPFFAPAYVPGNRIVIYGGHGELEAALRRQMDPPSFPVHFDALRADIRFVHLAPDIAHEVAGMRVTTLRQHHSGGSYGYRFEHAGRTVVYSTDSEHTLADPADTGRFVAFFARADLVVFDGMYSLADAISVKADWGHSSNVVGVELCQLAGVAHLCLFHHEPAQDDAAIEAVLAESRRLEEITRRGQPLRISSAYDGMEIAL